MAEIWQQFEEIVGKLWIPLRDWATSPEIYGHLAVVAGAITLAALVAGLIKRRIPELREDVKAGRFVRAKTFLHHIRDLVFPVLNILFLNVSVSIADSIWHQAWLPRVAQGLAVVFLIYSIIFRFIKSPVVRELVKWIGIPIALLQVFDWLPYVTAYLDTISLAAGDIRVSLYVIIRTLLFGAVLFWLGRISNTFGKQIIRSRQTLDLGTRELFAKLFEITLAVVLFLLLLQIMGINLTALAVFGGALGVGLGFGLQQIASNFVSGIIILIDRSVTPGDYLELEDGRSGVLRELTMRYGILETYDGKDIMVPNERFITSNFINWTHKNKKQRYAIEFQVAYKTDLDKLFELLKEVVASHPQVISGDDIPIEERPDAEIAGFGDFGVDILVEFWMEGIDDGKNRVGADILKMIWDAFKEHGIEFPFPQREIRILNAENNLNLTK